MVNNSLMYFKYFIRDYIINPHINIIYVLEAHPQNKLVYIGVPFTSKVSDTAFPRKNRKNVGHFKRNRSNDPKYCWLRLFNLKINSGLGFPRINNSCKALKIHFNEAKRLNFNNIIVLTNICNASCQSNWVELVQRRESL